MQSISRFVGLAGASLLAMVGNAFAAGGDFNAVPEPGSIALVSLAIGVMALVARRKK